MRAAARPLATQAPLLSHPVAPARRYVLCAALFDRQMIMISARDAILIILTFATFSMAASVLVFALVRP
jgi:hypothetical protein